MQPGDTVARFNARAGDYARYRPSYPRDVIREILAGLGDSPLVADVGAGTGISGALLAGGGARVIAIEPNAEMRAVAGAAGLDARDGRADALGLAAGSVDAVTAFQAFHWFANAATVAEFRRVLRPGGRVALVWNERDDRDPFTRAYGEVVDGFNSRMQAFSGLERGEQGLETLLTLGGFQGYRFTSYPNAQQLDREGLVGRARSTSYAPTEGPAHATMLGRLAELYEEFCDAAGAVRLVYSTDVHLAQS